SNDRTGWKIDSPRTDGWRVAYGPAGKDEQGRDYPQFLEVSRNDQVIKWIYFTHKERITRYAILPPRPSLNVVAILAVAFLDEHQEPFLALYDAESGEQL